MFREHAVIRPWIVFRESTSKIYYCRALMRNCMGASQNKGNKGKDGCPWLRSDYTSAKVCQPRFRLHYYASEPY